MKNAKSFSLKKSNQIVISIKETFYPKNIYMPWFLNTSLIYFSYKFLQQIQPAFSFLVKMYYLLKYIHSLPHHTVQNANFLLPKAEFSK